MKFSYISIILVVLVVIAVALAGCSGSSQKIPSGGKIQSKGTVSPKSSSSGSSGGSGSSVNGADLFGSLSYNWVEYKMAMGTGSGEMTVYMKWNRQTGKCTTRFEGPGAQGMQKAGLSEMDCGNTPGQTAAPNPNELSSDAQVSCSPLPVSVTVPAGTFSATKCTVTSKGNTASVWVVKNKFMVKMESNGTTMVLNAYG